MFEIDTLLATDEGWRLFAAAGAAVSLALFSFAAIVAYRRQNLRFDAAINNMSQGLTMFDRSGRLVLCNRRYIEMYGLSPDVVRPGCTVRQLVDHRVARGSLALADADKYIRLRDSELEDPSSP